MVNVVGKIKLNIEVGKASPSPPVGPALGQKGINIMAFCKDFNDYSSKLFKPGVVLPVSIVAYENKSYDYKVSVPSTSDLLMKVSGIEKGSSSPSKTRVGYVSIRQIYEIALIKLEHEGVALSKDNIVSSCKRVLGTVRSMGVGVVR